MSNVSTGGPLWQQEAPLAVRGAVRRSHAMLSSRAYGIALVACLVSTLTTNPTLTAASIAVLVLIPALLWRRGEPPVMVLALTMQWAQVATRVFQADAAGITVYQLSASTHIETAIWLGLIGIALLAVGMRIGIKHVAAYSPAFVDYQLRRFSIGRVFLVYAGLAAFSLFIPSLVWRALAFAQILLILGTLKWAAYYLLGYLTLRRRSRTGLFVGATMFELVTGIGYFSDFKMAFFFGALIFFSLHVRVTMRTILVVTVTAVALFGMSLVWVGIKHQYREYLSQGTKQQVVLVSPADRLRTFFVMARNVSSRDLSKDLKTLLERVGYVDFFAAAMDYVPALRSHTNGALLWRAIEHVLVPRLLNPNKPVLPSDSELTMEFTGLTLASGDRGTSISLGYMPENYLDFGPVMMFVPIFLFGVGYGLMYRYCLTRTPLRGIGYAFATVVLIGANQFEAAQVKLLGGMLMRFIVCALVLRYAMPSVCRWLQASESEPLNAVLPPSSEPGLVTSSGGV